MLTFPLFPIVVIGILVMTNAFFATTEFSLVTVRRTWLQQRAAQGNLRAEAALSLVNDLNKVVGGTQLGITVTSLALGWVGENAIAGIIEPVLRFPGKGGIVVVHSAALALAFLAITFLHLVLGELVPKQVALGRAERMSLAVAWPMTFYLKLVRLPMALLHASSFSLARRLGAKAAGRSSEVASVEEFKLVVAASQGSGALPPYQQEMIHRIIDLGQVLVREVMVPRTNIVAIPVNLTLEKLLAIVTEDQHSRIPVYDGSPEQIIGVLYTKDLLKVCEEEKRAASLGVRPREFVLRSLVRELSVVPETKPIDQLLQECQKRRRHMSLVVDEYGSTVGLVTVEDVLEQIVGEIEDEYDREVPPALRLGDRTVMLDARVGILDLENQYEIELPRDRGFQTLAGFVLDELGHIPHPGESFDYGGRRFTVTAMDDRRVARVKLEKLA